MSEICITIPVAPVAKGRPRFNSITKRTYTPSDTEAFALKVVDFWISNKIKVPAFKAIHLELTFFLPRPQRPKHKYPVTRPDADNLGKALQDALNKHAWNDDSQITTATYCKRYETDGCKIEMKMREDV